MSVCVYVVDDSYADRRMVCKRIAAADPSIVVRAFASLMDCYGLILREKPDYLVIDDHMEMISANETIPLIRRLGFSGDIIVVSGLKTQNRREKLIKLGAIDYLCKDAIFDDPSVLMQYLVASGATGWCSPQLAF